MEWKYGDVLVDAYNQKVIFLRYSDDLLFVGKDEDGFIYDDYIIEKFRKAE